MAGKMMCPCSFQTKSSDFKLMMGDTVICGLSMFITGVFTSSTGSATLIVGCIVMLVSTVFTSA